MIMAVTDDAGRRVVMVLPISHTPPSDQSLAIEIPHLTKRRLGLDDEPSWIVVSEVNRFVWPGPDLHFGLTGDASSVAFGFLPSGLFKMVRDRFAGALNRRLLRVVARTQ